jgi:superfamily II DNA or RNA helicase
MNRYNQILIELLNNVKTWSDLKIGLEKYNTVKTKTTIKKTIAGNIFEYFAKYYFLTEPTQTDLYKNVWLYNEIPLDISEKLKLPPIDHGIDILLQDNDNNYYAVQCKFKNDELKTLSWSGDKIANVFALGTLCEKVMVFTNASDVAQVAKNFESKYLQITNGELINIEPDIFENILNYALGKQPKELKKYTPKPHQTIAISKVVNHFSKNERGQLILPCGAGKTLTALWIKENLNYKTTLVLLPSLALLKQIKNDWARHKNSSYNYMCVCSEKDIDKDQFDSVAVHTYEIGGPVSTDPNIVNGFIKKPGKKVVFSTYQSLKVIRDACKINPGFSFDITICDEAHRTAGSKNKNVFTLVHDNKYIPSNKRLYMTATPKVVSTKLRTRLGEDYELLCDMSNPSVYGDEAFRMSFGEAIEQGILVDYKIIGIGVTDKEVKKFIEERNYVADDISITDIAHNFALNMVMNKYSAFHGLSFHSRVVYAKDFALRHKAFFEEIYSEHVEGKQSTTKRAKVLFEFKNSKKGIVSNARCLTEGVDVPTIDLIYFCDPKTSKIDIVQASGRALRTDTSGTKKMGYIVVPIFHHIEENLEAEIKRKPIFHHLIQVVRSLCDQDERLQAEINDIAFKKGKRNYSKIEIDFSDDDTERIIKFEGLEKKLRNVLFDEIIEKTKTFWDVMFKNLEAFIRENGHMNISKKQDKQLGNWIYEQRRQNRARKLTKFKKEKLNSIGFDWKSEEFREITDLDEIWWTSYEKLIDYYKENGDSDVPARYKKDKSLGTWVVAQRVAKRNNNLSQDRFDLLEELDFSWDPKVKVFDQFCIKLKEFKEKYGHTNVSIINDEFPKLGRWTNKYRVILNNGIKQSNGDVVYNGATLKKRQIETLMELGFKTSVRKTKWEDYYAELKEHYDLYNNTRPNQNENFTLYIWCNKIRKNPEKLTKQQKELLEKINFEFKITSKFSIAGSNQRWIERLTELQLFFEEHQHFDITQENEDFDGLYKWLVYQRRMFNNKKLGLNRIVELQNIGFDFNKHFKGDNKAEWDIKFKELEKYYKNNNTFFIATTDMENKKLLSWLRYQRKLFRDNKLSKDRYEELIFLGYSFEKSYRGKATISRSSIKHETLWQEKFEKLKEYYEINHTFLIPKTDTEYNYLKSWILYQKKLFKQGKLSNDKISKLHAIGFTFKENYRGKSIKSLNTPKTIKNDTSQSWLTKFELLKKYHTEFNTFLIPSTTKELLSLKSWLQYQKKLFKQNSIEQYKIEKLNSIGYSFDINYRGRKRSSQNDLLWDNYFEELSQFHLKYKTFLIPKHLIEYKKLKAWLQEQKRLYKAGRLSQERLNKLSQIGFSFDLSYSGKKFEYEVNPNQKKGNKKNKSIDSWEENYLKLLEYKIKNGNCNVTRNQDKKLGNFAYKQRVRYKNKELTNTQIQKLELINFEWEYAPKSISSAWETKFNLLKEFFIKNKHSVYKKSYGNKSLYNWVLLQRMEYKKGKLNPDRIEALNSLNFIWDTSSIPSASRPDDNKWLDFLEKLDDYKRINGNCLVPQIYSKDKALGRWVNDQRNNIKHGVLSKSRIDLLNDIGFIWNTKEYEWDKKIELLKDFFSKRGHFNVKQKDKEFNGLYYWIYKIRKSGTSLKRIEKLKKIGYDTANIKIIAD